MPRRRDSLLCDWNGAIQVIDRMSKAILNKLRREKGRRSLIGSSRLYKYTVAAVRKKKTESNSSYRKDAEQWREPERAKRVSHASVSVMSRARLRRSFA